MCHRQDSNLRLSVKSAQLSHLSYGGVFFFNREIHTIAHIGLGHR